MDSRVTELRNEDKLDAFIGARLRALRETRGMTLTSLGTEIGVTYQQVQKYESGANRISASRLYEIAAVLDVDISRFFPPAAGKPLAPDQDALANYRCAAKLSRIEPTVRTALIKLIHTLAREA